MATLETLAAARRHSAVKHTTHYRYDLPIQRSKHCDKGYDPTNGVLASTNHIRVAYGRHYRVSRSSSCP